MLTSIWKGGNLSTQVYVENLCYNKLVNLYYTNADDESTPLSAVALGYSNSIDNTNYEIWSSYTPDVNLDGITHLLNVTYQAVDISETYVQQLGQKVKASGPAPTVSKVPAPYATPAGFAQDITNWVNIQTGKQIPLTKQLLFDNIEPVGWANGSITAAQSYANPDYGYNWVRDSSLTMDVVATMYAACTNNVTDDYEDLFFRYAARRAAEQNDPNLQTGLGEPKFNYDGSVYTLPWGRPQNDGAATAAITLMRFSAAYMAKGGSINDIRQKIYNSKKFPNAAPVMKDLLFVAQNWSSPSFDLWEEEESDHFYTRMVQHRALVLGAAFAKQVGDTATAGTLSTAAGNLAATLPQFYDSIRNLILYEYGPVLRGKYSYKDAAVPLGVIHGYANDGIYSYSKDQVLASYLHIATSFLPIYGIASRKTDNSGRTLGIPIGRYPEDTYNGVATTGQGNPWYLCTATFAEVFYRAAIELQTAGTITVTNTSLPFWKYFSPQSKPAAGGKYSSTQAQFKSMIASLQGWGDAFMRTLKFYTPANGHLSEEYDRSSGKAVGAIDLTWSYSALLTATIAREQAIGNTVFLMNLGNLPAATNSSQAAT